MDARRVGLVGSAFDIRERGELVSSETLAVFASLSHSASFSSTRVCTSQYLVDISESGEPERSETLAASASLGVSLLFFSAFFHTRLYNVHLFTLKDLATHS